VRRRRPGRRLGRNRSGCGARPGGTIQVFPVVGRRTGVSTSRQVGDGTIEEHGGNLDEMGRLCTNPTTIDQRGATYLLDNESGELLYEYKHRGVLTYSETMARPLSFLAPYIGDETARNPLGLPDYDIEETKGRGVLKPAGKFMSLLKPIFALENKLQAQLLGAEEADLQAARREIEQTISSNHVVIYTYGLSPFSSEAVSLLEEAGCNDYKKVELGLEWFLLGKDASATRAELLAMTGQSSLPHVFIGGKHVGGLFSGTTDGGPGLAALQESGDLTSLLRQATTVQ
jgi:glutaredoxin-related protein